jgi:hypothetical protein
MERTGIHMMHGLDRKILRRTISPVNENGRWQRRYNKELYSIYKGPIITDIVRSARLRWAGHVVRMHDDEPPKKIITSNLGGEKGRGSPKLRWIIGVQRGARRLRIDGKKL